MPTKSQSGMAAIMDIGYPCHTSSPERGLRKRASSEADKPKHKASPPPSYNTAMSEEQQKVGLAPSSPSSKHLSCSLDASMVSLNPTVGTDASAEAELKDKEKPSKMEKLGCTNSENYMNKEVMEEQPGVCMVASNCSPLQDTYGEKTVSSSQHTGAMNGSLVQGQAPASLVPEVHCSVEQAEEIMGTEATSLGLGLGLADEAPLEDYHCIPVDHAVAVECDEQVLGELDAGFEEFSRRICALNENMSSFRRPRKGSDK